VDGPYGLLMSDAFTAAGEDDEDPDPRFRLSKCRQLTAVAEQAAQDLGIQYDLEKITT